MIKEQFNNLRTGDRVYIKGSIFPHQFVHNIVGEEIITSRTSPFGLGVIMSGVKYRCHYSDVELD